jgi:hypothetical protein
LSGIRGINLGATQREKRSFSIPDRWEMSRTALVYVVNGASRFRIGGLSSLVQGIWDFGLRGLGLGAWGLGLDSHGSDGVTLTASARRLSHFSCRMYLSTFSRPVHVMHPRLRLEIAQGTWAPSAAAKGAGVLISFKGDSPVLVMPTNVGDQGFSRCKYRASPPSLCRCSVWAPRRRRREEVRSRMQGARSKMFPYPRRLRSKATLPWMTAPGVDWLDDPGTSWFDSIAPSPHRPIVHRPCMVEVKLFPLGLE